MRYVSFRPAVQLQPFVKEIAIQETETEATYKVLPSAGLVIGFQYSGTLSYQEGGTEIPLTSAGISGINDRFRIFKNSPGIGTVLVTFKETGAAAFFHEPLHELFRESLSLDHFVTRSVLLRLQEQLQQAKGDQERIKLVEEWLISRLSPAAPDQLVVAALSFIHKSKGLIRIKDLAAQLHSSQSPLEKRFRHIVGVSPKKFSTIVRIKHLIAEAPKANSLTQLGYEAGFYDQAHFIKEFRTFTGTSPEVFFKDKRE